MQVSPNVIAASAGPFVLLRVAILAVAAGFVGLVLAQVLVWFGKASVPWAADVRDLVATVLAYGIANGLCAFFAAVYGPAIFSPQASHNPLMGLILTGPIGFFIGCFLGILRAVYVQVSAQRKRSRELRR